MTSYLTKLPEDPLFDWRIHADKREDIYRNILLTDSEVREVIRMYFDSQDVDEDCPACGRDTFE